MQATVTFADLPTFLTALSPAGDPFELGDWDTDLVPDLYLPHGRSFDVPVTLNAARDFFAIRHDAPAFGMPAVLYLRLTADHLKAGR
jgi:hypothetical protein